MTSEEPKPTRVVLQASDASPASTFCRLMERLAKADRQTLRLRFGERCDPRRLASLYDIGWILETFSDYSAFFECSIDEAAARVAGLDSWSSVTMRLPTGRHLMLVNPSHGPRRKTFDVAHELGHLVLAHTPVSLNRMNGSLAHPRFSDEQEKEAYGYALALLVPYAALLQFREQQAGDSVIARYYGISVEALNMRVKLLGLWA